MNNDVKFPIDKESRTSSRKQEKLLVVFSLKNVGEKQCLRYCVSDKLQPESFCMEDEKGI